MTQSTPIDAAHAAMQADPENDATRLAFYERLGDAELYLLLEDEAEGDQITPLIFEIPDGDLVLVFDRIERLTSFTGAASPYAALSGRAIADMLAGEALGLGLNLDVAPSAFVLPPEGVTWMADTFGHAPDEVEAQISEVRPPAGLPETLLTALDTKLATAMGLARCAYLVGVTYEGGGRGHMLSFVDAVPGAEGALAKAAGEALTFSGIEAGAMDVGFVAASDAMADRLGRVGLRFDLPEPVEMGQVSRAAPGSDPDAPPKLR
ncbi:SseB family protein [Ascidiaceihabitans sp.]|uniref:SseB family protein n=1 Tax=Ascidiaceihabitans sp. TaxID=1872644 RepID=UPI0032976D7E